MARGNRIVVTADPKGQFEEGYVGVGLTFYPGMIVERDTSVALKAGRWTYKYYNPGTDGEMPKGSYWLVTDMLNGMIGKTTTDSYAAGERVSLYSPRAGEEVNLLLLNIAGTADDHAIGEKLMVDTGTGKLIATTGTPESEVAQLLETVTDPTADTLAWCQWSGM
jgi:hypothetical protein